MSNPEGAPIWYELMTTDPDAAQAFYAALVGWSVAPAPGDAARRQRLQGTDGHAHRPWRRSRGAAFALVGGK